jgi:hypothetical protein
MYVILLVTRIAVRRQRDLGHLLGDVAGVAIEAAMCSGQRITRLRVVIKAPPLPAIRVVAERTICPQTPLMMLVAVACAARQRRVLEAQ